MSNTTFNMSPDQVEGSLPVPHRVAISPESHYSNPSLSPSPDSNSSVSNLSDREANSSPDINMLECCLGHDSTVDNPYDTTSPQDDVFCGVSRNLNQTFIATPVNGSVNFWNENLSVMSNREMGSDNYQTFIKNTEDGSNGAVMSPDSAGRESQLSSAETSRRGSTENDCCSLSSGEMVIRSNSFCKEDQSHLVVSSLEESVSLAVGHPALPAECNLLSTTLPDVLEKSPERVIEENMDHQCFGTTFIQAEELPTEENDMASSNSFIALPSENDGGLFMTFVCETSVDCGTEANAEAELLPHFPFTPEQGNAVVSTLSAVQHIDKDSHTSTPVHNIGNMMPGLPSFSESPCTGEAGRPGPHPVGPQQISVTPNDLVAAQLPSASNVKKMEIEKIPKRDFSSVKTKVVTKSVYQMSLSGPSSQHEPSQVNVPDVLEKSPERVIEENMDHQCFGTTFIQAELPAEENDMASSNSHIALPSENDGGLFMTFVSEASPVDCGKEAPTARAEAELLPHFPFTPEQGNAVVSTLSAVQHIDTDICTSTPVHNIGNMVPCLPSFPESPCTGEAGRPELHPVGQQQISVTPNDLVASQLPSASKVKKMEIKKFPKRDFGSVKTKVVTKSLYQMSLSGPSSQHKPSQVNVNNKPTEARRGASIRITPAKSRSTGGVSTATKMVSDAQRQVNTGAANLGSTIKQSSRPTAVEGQGKSRASTADQHPTANKHASAVQCSEASSETEQGTSSQVSDAAAQHSGSQTLCCSSLEKSPDISGQKHPKPTPKKGVLNKIEVRSGSAVGQDKPPVLTTRPRSLLDSLILSSRLPREKRAILKHSASFINPKANTHLGQRKPGNLNCSEATNASSENSPREVKRISLVESSKSTSAGGSLDESKNRFQGQPSPRQKRGAPHSPGPAASPRPATLSTKQRQAAWGRDGCRTSKAVGTPQTKQKSSTGSQRLQEREPSLGTASTASIKPQLNGSQLPHSSARPSLMGPPPTPTTTTRPPRKTPGPSRTLTGASVHTEMSGAAGSTQVSGGASQKPSPFKTVLKTRLFTTPGKNTVPSALPTACKLPATPSSKGTSNSTVGPLKRTGSARLLRLTSYGTVDKNTPKASSQPQASRPTQRHGPPDVVPASVAEAGRKEQSIQLPRSLLAASNCRFEAITVVLQRALAERDEATKQCRHLSQELVNLQGELVCSVHSSESLEKERDELRLALEDALCKVQEQHQQDLAELEQGLQAFYQAEWDKVHLTYQEETDKCKTLMQQQIEELKANHEAMKLELESSHEERLQSVKQQYEKSLEELSKVHNEELQSLDKSLKETGATLTEKIEELTVENNALAEKVTAEENRRKQLAERSQMDSHTLYLEQELESLKVVLDIKNKQLHQQEKKLMEVGRLTEKNVKLDESLTKVQQENEDLKARMERHYALSRQLSTEQAVLQESLHKESKVNKRLSMENEELMWKLHNGDLSSPRKVSPTSTSPSRSFSLQSPRGSADISSPPVSPR